MLAGSRRALIGRIMSKMRWGMMRHVIDMKRQGYHVVNSDAQLGVMINYFHDRDALSISTQSHVAHERRLLCEALTML